MLKIGVTSCYMYPDPNRVVFGPKTLLYMGHDLAQYLADHKVMPVLIPDILDEKIFKQFLSQLDGFVFQGGSDINPEMYGESPLNFRWEGDPQRDMFELKVLNFALESKKPILGICRGMQLLNVHFGGTLYQDIPTQKKDAIVHYHPHLYDEHFHDLSFEGDLFQKIYKGSKCKEVNSVHHQGIKNLSPELKIEAISPDDGLVEALSRTDKSNESKILAIQWHPEFFHSIDCDTLEARPVLDHFLSLCE